MICVSKVIRNSVIIFFVCHFCNFSKAQSNNDLKEMRSLISKKIIKGSLYNSSWITLTLKDSTGEKEFLVDSVFYLNRFNKNKVGFFLTFNDVSSGIKYGYAEIKTDPYESKLILLSDIIDKITKSRLDKETKFTVNCSTYVRSGYKTFYTFYIATSNLENKLFNYSSKDRTIKVKD